MNNGPSDARSVVVSDTLPVGVRVLSVDAVRPVTPTQWQFRAAAGDGPGVFPEHVDVGGSVKAASAKVQVVESLGNETLVYFQVAGAPFTCCVTVTFTGPVSLRSKRIRRNFSTMTPVPDPRRQCGHSLPGGR